MPPAGFEPAFPASERPQPHSLDRTANGIGCRVHIRKYTTGLTKTGLEHGTGAVRAKLPVKELHIKTLVTVH
jgi:hypothetical protein